jgi:hypothetical protein
MFVAPQGMNSRVPNLRSTVRVGDNRNWEQRFLRGPNEINLACDLSRAGQDTQFTQPGANVGSVSCTDEPKMQSCLDLTRPDNLVMLANAFPPRGKERPS